LDQSLRAGVSAANAHTPDFQKRVNLKKVPRCSRCYSFFVKCDVLRLGPVLRRDFLCVPDFSCLPQKLKKR